jgi:RHS repeat-associated protein
MGVTVQSNFPSLHTISGLTFNFPALDDALGVGYVRDSLGRISTRLNNQANRGRDYAYDDAGRLTEFKDFTIQGGGGTCTPIYASDDPAPGEEPIGYDCPPPESRSYGSPTTFTYDAVGNRTDNGAVLDGNRLTRFGRWTLEYDDDGNLTRKYDATCPSTCERRYSWNSLSQLTGVYTAGAGWVYFGYDGLGRRVRREMESGPKESHVYDGDHLILATDGNGALLGEWAYYPGVDQPHSFRWQGRVYYYQQDGAGNVTGVIADDGTLANRTEYEPFGTLVPGTGAVSGLGFKGREHDPPTGLVYMRARWYDPELGRFISEDPIGLSGGINPYAFAGNDPVNFADPSGLDKCKEGAGPGWTDVYIEDSGWWCYKKDGGQPLPPVPVTASPPNWPNYPPAIPGAPQCATCGGGGGGGTPSGEAEWREQRAAESFDRNRRVVGAFNKWGSCIVDNNLATLEMAGYAAAAVVGVNAVRVYDAGGFAAVGVKSVGGAVGMLTGYTSLTTALELIGGAFVTVPVATGVVGGLVFSQLAVAAYCAIH